MMSYVLDYISEKVLCAFFVIIITTWSLLYIITQPINCKVEFEMHADGFGDICVSDECVKISAALKSSIDPSVNPCDDFYQFTCGKWLQTHDESSVIDEAQKILNTRIKNLLSNSKTDDELIKKVQTFYKSCNEEDVYEPPGFEVCTRFLNELGLPTIPRVFKGDFGNEGFNWIKSEIKYQKMFGDGAFLSFVSDYYTSNVIMTVNYMKSTIFDDEYDEDDEDSMQNSNYYYYNDDDHEDDQYFDDFGIHAIQQYLSSVSVKRESNEIETVLRRLEIVKETWNVSGETITTEYAIDGLEESLKAAGIPISDTWKECISYIRNSKYSNIPKVSVNLQQVNAIFELIDNSESDLVELFLWINAMKTLKDEYAEISKPSYLSCLDIVQKDMDLAMVHGLMNEYLNGEAMAEMRVIIKSILEVYADVLKKVYIDKVDYVMKQMHEMDLYLGYPDWISDSKKLEEHYEKLNFSDSDFKFNLLQLKFLIPNFKEDQQIYGDIYDPMTVNAFYNSIDNIIAFPMGIFTFPFYHLGLTFLNYGSIGTIVGHEVIHALDELGYLSAYSPIVDCIKEQYEKQYNYSMSEAELKEPENLADTGSIYLSFEAYRRYKDNSSLIEKKLVGFQEYTHEQMFFMTYANHWCGVDTVDHEDSHSSSNYRIISALKNSIEFSEAFNCPLGSEMNSGRIRCTLF